MYQNITYSLMKYETYIYLHLKDENFLITFLSSKQNINGLVLLKIP